MTPAPIRRKDSTRTLGNQVIKPLATGIKRMARVKWCLRPCQIVSFYLGLNLGKKVNIENCHKEFTD